MANMELTSVTAVKDNMLVVHARQLTLYRYLQL